MTDREILATGHGGYNVFVRFNERWVKVDQPEGEVEPPLEKVSRLHPYLQRVVAAGAQLEALWVAPLRPQEVSSESATRLAYVFWDRRREQYEGVVIRDAGQLARWLEATERASKRRSSS